VTNSREWKRPYPEEALTGSMFCACPVFPPRFFLSSSTVVTWLLKVTRGLLTPSGFPWVCACGTGYYATYVVTEGTWPLRKCPLGRPRPIFSMVTGNSPGYLPKKSAGGKPGMRRTYFRSGPLPDRASSIHVNLSLPVKRSL
jgi:hypothetical protein